MPRVPRRCRRALGCCRHESAPVHGQNTDSRWPSLAVDEDAVFHSAPTCRLIKVAAHGSRATPRRTICVQRALKGPTGAMVAPARLRPGPRPQHLGAPSARGRELNPMLRQPRPPGPQPGTVLSALDGGQRPDTVVVLPLRRTARSSVREGDGLPRRYNIAPSGAPRIPNKHRGFPRGLGHLAPISLAPMATGNDRFAPLPAVCLATVWQHGRDRRPKPHPGGSAWTEATKLKGSIESGAQV